MGAAMEVRPLRGLDKGNPTKTHPQSQAALKCLAPQSIAEPRVKAAVRGKKIRSLKLWLSLCQWWGSETSPEEERMD